MREPDGPHIKTVYRPDGTMTKEARGFGGTVCLSATAPYARRHGGLGEITPTAEADEPSCLERRGEDPEREHA